MAQRRTKTVILRETGEELVVNETHKQLLKELEKPEEVRDTAYINSQNEHEPYYDPNIHDLKDANEDEESAEDKPKRKPRVRVTAADKKAAEQAEKDAAAADSDDDDDED